MLGQIIGRAWSIIRATWIGWRRTAGPCSRRHGLLCGVLVVSALPGVDRRLRFFRPIFHVRPGRTTRSARPSGQKCQPLAGRPLGGHPCRRASSRDARRTAGAAGLVPGSHRRLHAVGNGLRPHLGRAPSADNGWLAAIRAALWDRLLAFLTLLAIGALLVAVFLSDAVLAGLRPFFPNCPPGGPLWHIVQLLATIGCDAVLLATIYRVLPKKHVFVGPAALGGGLLAAVVWAIGRSVLLSLVCRPAVQRLRRRRRIDGRDALVLLRQCRGLSRGRNSSLPSGF